MSGHRLRSWRDSCVRALSDPQVIAARGFGLRSAEDLSASGRHRSIPPAACEEQPLEPRAVRALRQI